MIKHDLNWFKENRYEHYNYVKNEIIPANGKFKVISAPVKCGKRHFVIISKLLELENEHIFLSALHRKADRNQREEYKTYDIKVFSNPNEIKNKCAEFINKIKNKKKIIIHLDELDFGCGDKQNIANIIRKYLNDKKVEFILYSATSEVAEVEFLHPNKFDNFKLLAKFKPSEQYYSISNYLQDNLMFNAKEFFSYNFETSELTISEQGNELIENLKQSSDRFIGIVRLSGNIKDNFSNSESKFELFKKNKNEIREKYDIRLRFIGSKDEFIPWDNEEYWEELNHQLKYIFVINQVAGRSTEWKCHPYLIWYHCLRHVPTPTSTIIQDQERIVYYKTYYNRNNKIRLYGDVLTAKYSSGRISYTEYNDKSTRKLNSRLNNKRKGNQIIMKKQQEFNSWNDIPPEYTKKRSLVEHIFKRTIKNRKVSDKCWNKYKHLEGFLMTNIRGSIKKIVNGKDAIPVYFRSDIEKELKEGINERSRIRINIFYEDGEKNPDNYKFIIRELDKIEEVGYKNTSIYESM